MAGCETSVVLTGRTTLPLITTLEPSVRIGEPAHDRDGGRRPMRVYISVDMEGIGGISHPHPTDPKDARYPVSVDLMVGETNAAIEGALVAGATDILVNDSHASMHNLLPEAINPAATVLQGQKAWSMVAGAADGFDVALFVGYHARAGHPRGTIAHTYSGRPVETRLDGRPTGEYGLNALVLGAWGIPVRTRHRRRRARRGGRRLAAVGGTGGRQEGRRRKLGRVGPSLPGARAGSGRRRTSGPARCRRGARMPLGCLAGGHRGGLSARRDRRPRGDPPGSGTDRRPDGSPGVPRRGLGLPGVPRCRSPRRSGGLGPESFHLAGRASSIRMMRLPPSAATMIMGTRARRSAQARGMSCSTPRSHRFGPRRCSTRPTRSFVAPT